jgi:ribose transport system ATP-binding protein
VNDNQFMRPPIELRQLSKSYGGQSVLNEVSFSLLPGQITALLGENGAGKSTLAKILAGAVEPDSGEIFIGEDRLRFDSPREALINGFSLIPQELIYVPRMTVAENICLGRWPRSGFITTNKRILKSSAEESARLGFDLPMRADMFSLSFADQQAVEIVKAMSRRSKLIILDEPTAALNSEQSERLLDIMRSVAASGTSIVYISHRLDEVFRACSHVQVLRNGSLVFSGSVSETRPSEVISHILGREETVRQTSSATMATDVPILEVLSLVRDDYPQLRGISLNVGKNEIVGVYGLSGSGAETLAETLGGLHSSVRGGLTVAGRSVPVPKSPRDALKASIGYMPADRKLQGLIATMSVKSSYSLLVMRSLARLGFLRLKKEDELARTLAKLTLLRSRSLNQAVSELSGGNQQKVLMGSRIALAPAALVLHEPTRGVDVGARVELHNILRQMADAGTGQLVVTSDIEEAVTICDRLLIFREGRIVHEICNPTEDSQIEALQAAGGLL